MDIEKYIDEDTMNNIFNQYQNVFVISYDKSSLVNGKYVGHLLLKVNVSKDKQINVGDIVEVRPSKIKARFDTFFIADSYWVKPFLNSITNKVKVKTLTSKTDGSKREYFISYEYLELNFKQFIERRLLETIGSLNYSYIQAYRNFQDRRKVVGYYNALNETSKHYMVKHDDLKNTIIPSINNAIRKFKKEWEDLCSQNSKNIILNKIISDSKVESKNNVVDFKKSK